MRKTKKKKKKIPFTFMHGGSSWEPGAGKTFIESHLNGFEKHRWITHDQNDNFAGEFETKEEAKLACDKWNSHNGTSVSMEFIPARTDYGGDRGEQKISVKGCRFKYTTPDGYSSEVVQRLRNAIAEFGLLAVQTTLWAFSDLTLHADPKPPASLSP